MAMLWGEHKPVRRTWHSRHLGRRGQSGNIDQVGRERKLQEPKIGNRTAERSAPNTAGAALAPAGCTLTATVARFDHEDVRPANAWRRAAN